MAEQPKRFFDLWFVQANTVTKEVPFHVVTDWIQQCRAVAEDRIKPSGTTEWYPLGSVNAFQPYFPIPEPDEAETMAPVEMEQEWHKTHHEEDDDVDMIPLIDISLVLLIFFMMTMTVSAISRIKVPDMQNPVTIETDPGVLRIDIDLLDGKPVYALGLGVHNPTPEDDNLSSDVELMMRIDSRLSVVTVPPKVRIAAHGDVTHEVVEEVMNGLDRRLQKGQIREIAVEVNEQAEAMILFDVRPQGSPQFTEGVSAQDILEGVKEGIWDPTDEVQGPGDRDWVSLENHPIFAQAMADYEPPPPPHPEDETRLDMNPLIDVALVLLIFFMLTTTYEELRKEFIPPPAQRQDLKGIKTDKDVKDVAVRVHASLDGDKTVYTVEDEVVPKAELEAKFKEYIETLGHKKLAMEVDDQVPWKAEVAIYDAAAGAKFDEIIRVVRSPKK